MTQLTSVILDTNICIYLKFIEKVTYNACNIIIIGK